MPASCNSHIKIFFEFSELRTQSCQCRCRRYIELVKTNQPTKSQRAPLICSQSLKNFSNCCSMTPRPSRVHIITVSTSSMNRWWVLLYIAIDRTHTHINRLTTSWNPFSCHSFGRGCRFNANDNNRNFMVVPCHAMSPQLCRQNSFLSSPRPVRGGRFSKLH